ncbi:proline-rich receptor-like protein kinase PERK10 [Micropterus dolomieu]|uniref:proline-rich receptor-like protein kinase PERK10 n=1 Tax=Micropterus dolomieu TaxID=147949 RepID=UPI001E8D6E22|nr:proline-rich receptor-like protein kinase PERK10 [Micropterus dolomieu]
MFISSGRCRADLAEVRLSPVCLPPPACRLTCVPPRSASAAACDRACAPWRTLDQVHLPPSSESAGLAYLPSPLGHLPQHPLGSPSCLVTVSLPPHSSTNSVVSSPVPPFFLGPRYLPVPLSQPPWSHLLLGPQCSSVPRARVPPASTSPSPPLPQTLFPSINPLSPEGCFWVLSVQHTLQYITN